MQTKYMGTKRYELTESEWLRIKDMLPSGHPKEGKCDARQNVITAVQ